MDMTIKRKEFFVIFYFALVCLCFPGCGAQRGEPLKCDPNNPCPPGMECVDSHCQKVGVDGETDVMGDFSPDNLAQIDTIDAGEENGIETPVDLPPEGPDMRDGDGDTIRDVDEGDGAIDTDGDTTPDSEDPDSDDDAIPDSIEAGDQDLLTPPVDSDSDTRPDFRDGDSDEDTITDAVEAADDGDGDGQPNFRDTDSDGDWLTDTIEAGDSDPATPPVDTDEDEMADFMDVDSDGDWISDYDESLYDTDGDDVPEFRDLDSDGDTVPDETEAGDTDLSTPPGNCDGDPLPNYQDTDSDNDGISDSEEGSYGTDYCVADSDGDGVTDLVELSYGSSPLDPSDNPRSRGDFVFIVPYLENPDPTKDSLVFSTSLQKADIYFTIDTSGSMAGEIANLRNDLQTVIVPGVLAAIPDVWFGVGRFEDCPNDRQCTNAMRNLQDITNDITAVQNALNTMTTTCGGSEPYPSNLWVIATGDTSPWASYTPYFSPHPRRCTDPATIGWPCFRPGAIPIVIQFGDELFSQNDRCNPRKTTAEAIAALNSINAKYIGVNSGSTRPDMIGVANGTGSVDLGGNPLVFDINPNGTGLGSQVVDAVVILANYVPIEVSATVRDDTADAVDATIFIERIEPNTVGGVSDPVDPARVCVGGLEVADRTGDGIPDVFTRVLPGTTVCFDIYPRMNTTVPAAAEPQIFRAFIDVLGDGFTLLDTREVYFLVPPYISGGT